MGLLLLQYQNCSQHNDPSPFEFKSLDLSSAKETDVLLEAPAGALDVTIYESMISLGGSCQTGKAASHYIELKLQNSNNQPIKLRNVTCPDCYTLVNARCEHGRYNAVVPVECAAYQGQSSSLYRLLGQMVTKDEKGNETREAAASFDRFLQIQWVAGSCP
jgi:hypothetical protein